MLSSAQEFNDKWCDRLERGFYGLDIHHPDVIKACDDLFEKLQVDYPRFTYSQIKLKFGKARVYLEHVDYAYIDQLEKQINLIINEKSV